jgi:hypothetical protein
VSSRDRVTGSNAQLWLCARSAKFTIISQYPLLSAPVRTT